MMVSNAELKSIPVIYIYFFQCLCFSYYPSICPYNVTCTSFSQYALYDRERYLSTFGFILANTTFDNIFLIIGSKMAGRKSVTGPFVLPGFCSGARISKPVFISRLLHIQLFKYLYFFDLVFQDRT